MTTALVTMGRNRRGVSGSMRREARRWETRSALKTLGSAAIALGCAALILAISS